MALQWSLPGGRCRGIPRGHPPGITLPSRPVPRYGCEAPKIPSPTSLKRFSFGVLLTPGPSWTGIHGRAFTQPNAGWTWRLPWWETSGFLCWPQHTRGHAHGPWLGVHNTGLVLGRDQSAWRVPYSLTACTGSWLLPKDAAHIYIQYIYLCGPLAPSLPRRAARMPLQHHAPVLRQTQVTWLLAPEDQAGVEGGLERGWEPVLELKAHRGKPRHGGDNEGGDCKGFGARSPASSTSVPVPRRAGLGTHPGVGGRWEPARAAGRAGKAPFCSPKRGGCEPCYTIPRTCLPALLPWDFPCCSWHRWLLLRVVWLRLRGLLRARSGATFPNPPCRRCSPLWAPTRAAQPERQVFVGGSDGDATSRNHRASPPTRGKRTGKVPGLAGGCASLCHRQHNAGV